MKLLGSTYTLTELTPAITNYLQVLTELAYHRIESTMAIHFFALARSVR